MSTEKTVLVAGASRGLGLALAREWLKRGWRVVATTRGSSAELEATKAQAGDRLTVETLELTDPQSAEALRERLAGVSLDMLFVNAGVASGPGDRADRISTDEFVRILVTNALSPIRLIETLGSRVKPDGTIAVMSSSLGSLALNESGGWEAYRASKAAVNMMMRSYAARHSGEGRTLALVDPGWVRTDMGGANATLGVEDSVPGIVDALEARAGQPGLSYFNYQGKTVPW